MESIDDFDGWKKVFFLVVREIEIDVQNDVVQRYCKKNMDRIQG